MKKINAITWGLIAITFIISIVSLIFLPDEIAVQWNGQGVSNTASKYTVLYLPVISFIICFAYMKMAKTLQHIVPLITAMLVLIAEGVILINAFGVVDITQIGTETSNLWIGRIISIIVGVVIMVIGNRLPKTIMNPFFPASIRL